MHDVASGRTLAFEGDSLTLDLDVDCDHPYVSAITMVAPSPDWFVGISRLNMRRKNGRWVKSRSGNLRVYDSGTDSGTTLFAGDVVTSPPENIAMLEGAPFDGKVAATYTVVRM